MIIEWIRLGIAAMFIVGGLIIIGISIFGVFRFGFVINRMHIAASCDTLGILSMLVGLVILNGLNVMSLKLVLIIIFLWLASPVSSHLISKLEVETNAKIEEECEVIK